MDVNGKCLESVRQRDAHRLYTGAVFYKRFVARESEIYNVALVLYCLLNIRLHEQPELPKI